MGSIKNFIICVSIFILSFGNIKSSQSQQNESPEKKVKQYSDPIVTLSAEQIRKIKKCIEARDQSR